MPAAEWSKKAAVENEQDMLVVFIIGQADW
jgi:hypothetical protein